MSKLGIHSVIGPRTGIGDLWRAVAATPDANRIIAKTVDDYGFCQEAKQILGERVLTIARRRASDNILNPGDTAQHNADAWWESMSATIAMHPEVDCWESYNEIHSAWQLQADISNILVPRMASAYGRKMCVWNLSTGTPQYPEYDNSEQYTAIGHTCAALVQHGGFIGLHEYGGVGVPSAWLKDSTPHHATRYCRLAAWLDERGPLPQFVISECAPSGGYDWGGNVDAFVADLAWYDSELIKDPVIAGCTIFTLGNWEGHNTNYQDALPALTQHIVTHPHTELPNPEPPDPEPPPMPPDPRIPYTSFFVLIHPNEYQRQEKFAIAGKWNYSATTSADDAGRGHSLPGLKRRVLVTSRVSWPDPIADFLNANYPGIQLQVLEDSTAAYLDALIAGTPAGQFPFTLPGAPPVTPPTQPPPESVMRFTVWPSDYEPHAVTQRFGANPANYDQYGLPGHEGVDIRAPTGTPILCVSPGVVSRIHTDAATHNYGLHVRIDHHRGADTHQTIYAHLSSFTSSLSIGQPVDAGETLGLAGSTGNSSGAHLHFGYKILDKTYTDAHGNVWPHNLHNPEPMLAELEPGLFPNVPVTPPPTPAARFAGGIGLHGDADGGQIETIEIECAQAATLLKSPQGWWKWYQPSRDSYNLLATYGIPASRQLLRLSHIKDERKPPTFYVNGSTGIWDLPMQEAYGAGVRWFELGNEPNLTQDGLGVAWSSASDYCQSHLRPILDLIQTYYAQSMPGLRLITPGLSPQSSADMSTAEWLEAFKTYGVLARVHGIGAHAYWDSESGTYPMESTNGGRHYRIAFSYLSSCSSGAKVWITEASNNAGHDSDSAKGDQCARWASGLESDKVAAGFFFVVKATDPTFNARRETWVRTPGNVISDIPRAFAAKWAQL